MLLSFEIANAQIYPMSIGPELSYKFGISTVTTPLGRKNGLGFSKIPDVGLAYYLPMSQNYNLGLLTNISYSNYSYIIKNANISSDDYAFHHSYLVISPNFYARGVILGFGIGIPLGANYDGVEIKTSTMKTMVELKLGGEFPLYEDETGRLNFFVLGHYMLSDIFDNFVKNDPLKNILATDEPINTKHNPRTASINLGFNFVFNLSGVTFEEEQE